jgi:hypothetical protein
MKKTTNSKWYEVSYRTIFTPEWHFSWPFEFKTRDGAVNKRAKLYKDDDILEVRIFERTEKVVMVKKTTKRLVKF